jgi:hypothetical protein
MRSAAKAEDAELEPAVGEDAGEAFDGAWPKVGRSGKAARASSYH